MNGKQPGFRDQFRAAPKLVRILVPVVVILLIVGVASGGGSGSSSSRATSPRPTTPPVASSHVAANPNRPNEATESDTPSVGATHPVTVDGLVYKIEAAHTATTAKDSFGNALSAVHGMFIVLRLRVHSDKADDEDFNDNVKLVAGGQSYDPDSEFDSITDNGIGSHATVTGNLAFDVPRSTSTRRPQLKLTELGFGDTRGYILLPKLASPRAVPTPASVAPTPTPTPGPAPSPTPTPSEDLGSYSHAGDTTFCSAHECIGSFTTEPGYIVQCSDGTYSHSGGISGSCSRHGGNG